VSGTITSTDIAHDFRRLSSPSLLDWLASLEPLGWTEQTPAGAWRLTDKGLRLMWLMSRDEATGDNANMRRRNG
jgi:Mn-dependent DtxR family transcriptional regulator